MLYMISEINEALNKAVREVVGIIRAGHRMHEPDYTAAITLCLPSRLEQILGSKVKVGGCFIHQNPIVHFENQQKGCELGDLLVLCRKKGDGEQRHNAALFQLKMSGKHVETPDNLIQLKLYTEWPAFTIGLKFDSNNCYEVEPQTVTPGAQYMFVVNPYIHTFHHRIRFCNAIPETKMPVELSFSFGKFLWDFIHWQNGRPFAQEDMAADDEWSRLMWDVLARTDEVLFHRKNISPNGLPRQNGDFFQFLASEYNRVHRDYYLDYTRELVDGSIPEKEDPVIYDENEHGAISILFIDIDDSLSDN